MFIYVPCSSWHGDTPASGKVMVKISPGHRAQVKVKRCVSIASSKSCIVLSWLMRFDGFACKALGQKHLTGIS